MGQNDQLRKRFKCSIHSTAEYAPVPAYSPRCSIRVWGVRARYAFTDQHVHGNNSDSLRSSEPSVS